MQGKSSKAKKLNETDEERAARLENEAVAAREGARRREEAARCSQHLCHNRLGADIAVLPPAARQAHDAWHYFLSPATLTS